MVSTRSNVQVNDTPVSYPNSTRARVPMNSRVENESNIPEANASDMDVVSSVGNPSESNDDEETKNDSAFTTTAPNSDFPITRDEFRAIMRHLDRVSSDLKHLQKSYQDTTQRNHLGSLHRNFVKNGLKHLESDHCHHERFDTSTSPSLPSGRTRVGDSQDQTYHSDQR